MAWAPIWEPTYYQEGPDIDKSCVQREFREIVKGEHHRGWGSWRTELIWATEKLEGEQVKWGYSKVNGKELERRYIYESQGRGWLG